MSKCWVVFLCLLAQSACRAEQFVDLTVEIEVDDWSYWFTEDGRGLANPTKQSESIFNKPTRVHCIFSTNAWLMEGDFYSNAKAIRWFGGTNIIQHSVITQTLPGTETNRMSQISNFIITNPGLGTLNKRVYETADGNPGRPIRVTDLMEFRGRICWLAFCSGSVLKQKGRKLYPPSDLWKEIVNAPYGFTDRVTTFDDSLGLPRRTELFTPLDRLTFNYQVRQSTNMLGWNIPTEFYGVQYCPARTNGWDVQLTFKGKVTEINPGDEATIQKLIKRLKEN